MESQDLLSMSELKQKVAADIRPLVTQIQNPESRFYAIMTLLREGWEDGLANHAYEASRNIQDPEQKVSALQTLMTEINFREREVVESHAVSPEPTTND